MINIVEQIAVISNNDTNTRNLCQRLSKLLNLKVSIIDNTGNLSSTLKKKVTLIIIDTSAINKKPIKELEKTVNNSDCPTVLLNTPNEVDISMLTKWRRIKGVFSNVEEEHNLILGLKAIVNGENWLSRTTINKLLNHYEKNNINDNSENNDEVNLTKREVQILKSLQYELSNLRLAESLYISEHTIKTHLNNIYRKINVKNRQQAIFWARRNL